MRYAGFIKWIQESDIDQKHKDAILKLDVNKPHLYLDSVRKILLEMIDDKDVKNQPRYQDKSLGQVYEMLDPLKATGKEFIASILQYPLDKVKELLSDPIRLNQAIHLRESIKLPAGSVYAATNDYLGYLCSADFSSAGIAGGNESRMLDFFRRAFNEGEISKCGYQAADGENTVLNDQVKLAQAMILEAALFSVDAEFSEKTALLIAELGEQQGNADDHAQADAIQFQIGKLHESMHPILQQGIVKGHLEECDRIFASTSLLAEYRAFMQARAKLESLQHASHDQDFMRNEHLKNMQMVYDDATQKNLSVEDLRALYRDLTNRTDRAYQSILEYKAKEDTANEQAAKKAVTDALRSLSDLCQAIAMQKQQVTDNPLRPVKSSSVAAKLSGMLLPKRGKSAPPVQPQNDDAIYDAIRQPFANLTQAIIRLLAPGEGGDELTEKISAMLFLVAEQNRDILFDDRVIGLTKDAGFYNKIATNVFGGGTEAVMYASLAMMMPLARANLICLTADGKPDLNKVDVAGAESLFLHKKEEIKDEALLARVDAKYKALQAGKKAGNYSENQYKAHLVNLAREAAGLSPFMPNPYQSIHEAAIGVLQSPAVSDGTKSFAEVLVSGAYTDGDLEALIRSPGFENSEKNINRAMGAFTKMIVPYLSDRALFELTDRLVRCELNNPYDAFRTTTLAKPFIAAELERHAEATPDNILPPVFLAHMQQCLVWKEKESEKAMSGNKKLASDESSINREELKAAVDRGMNTFISFNILAPAEDAEFMSLDALRRLENQTFDTQIRGFELQPDFSMTLAQSRVDSQAAAQECLTEIRNTEMSRYHEKSNKEYKAGAESVSEDMQIANLMRMQQLGKIRKDVMDVRSKLSAAGDEERQQLQAKLQSLIEERERIRQPQIAEPVEIVQADAVPVPPAAQRDLAKDKGEMPSREIDDTEPVVMVPEYTEEDEEVEDVVRVAEPDINVAKTKALHILMRLQRLPDPHEITGITNDVENLKRAIHEFKNFIPGGLGRPELFAENLMASLPPHVVLYDESVLAKIDALHNLYENDNDAAEYRHFMSELWSAVNTKKNQLDGQEDEKSKREYILGVNAAWTAIENENRMWGAERSNRNSEDVDAQKIATLSAACDDYMQHLGRKIYEGIRDHDFELCKELVFRDNNKLKFNLPEAMNIINVNNKNIRSIRDRDSEFDLAIEKYQKVKEMKSQLESGLPAGEKLANFQVSFNANRQFIEKRRDSAATKFVKVVLTILTAGVAAAFGLWRVKGEKFSKDIDRQLGPDNKSNGPKK